MKFKFFTFEQYIKSWSVWGIALMTVISGLSDHITAIANVLPDNVRHIVLTVLGVVTLIARAIKQPSITSRIQ